MSNRSAAPFPLLGTRFVPAEPLGQVPPRDRERILPAAVPASAQAERKEVPVHELSFRHLKTLEEIARIVHLREEIQLPASILADPGFAAREKKGTRKDSSPRSSAAERISAPSGSSRWIADWRPAKGSCKASRFCRPTAMKAAGRSDGSCSTPGIAAGRMRSEGACS